MSDIIVSENYNRAVTLHRRITANAQAAQESLYEMCKALKEMRDGKLYKELGYTEFNEYCTTELGISDRTVYRYISIADNLSEDLVTPVSRIGATKLYLLSTLSEEERTEITQTTDVEAVSKRELEEQIKQLREENKRIADEAELDRKEQENANAAAQRYKNECKHRAEDQMRLEGRIHTLESQVKELESRPVEVAVEQSHEADDLRKAIEKLNSEHDRELTELQEDNVRAIRSINDKHNAELEQLRAGYEKKLSEVPAPEKVTIPDQKAVFKAYLSIAVDASKRLTEFVKSNPDELFKAKTKELFNKILQEV